MGLGVLIGAQGGALLSSRMQSARIRSILAVVVAIFAVRMILRVVW
jgi:uncharacterized membrane protein YfcA